MADPVIPSHLADAFRLLGARPPNADERAAVRAVCRGTATPGQQRQAMAYMLGDVCGFGRSPFAQDAPTHAFRSGSLAVATTIASIADVELTFPRGREEPDDGV